MKRATKLGLIPLSCALIAACGTLTIQPKTAPNGIDTTMGRYSDADAERYIIVTMTDAAHEQLVQGERVDRGELPPMYAKFIGNLARTYGLKRVADWPLGSINVRCLVFEVTDPSKRAPTIAALAKERYVESAQPLSLFYAMSENAPAPGQAYNDPYWNMQSGLEMMQVSESHRWATGKGVRVAVIDTGVDTRHPDLSKRVVGIRNFVDRDTKAFNEDVHGTAVTGVIAAASNNGVGLVGVAPEADILGLKACWQEKSVPTGAHCSTFTLAKALNFAIDQEVDVINLSLAGPPDPLLARLVAKAIERNILVVGAEVEKWPNGFPAGVEGVIGVTNAGADPQNAQADRFVSAPGTQVLSARPNNDYDFYSGSSFATAHVAGLTALIRQRKPHLSSSVVKELIATTSQAQPPSANACRALARIVSEGECGPAETRRASQH